MAKPERTETDCPAVLRLNGQDYVQRLAKLPDLSDRAVEVVPRSVADTLAVELERARKTLWKAGFSTCADACAEALAEYRSAYPREETTT